MVIASIAAAVALNITLACPGAYPDVETTPGIVNQYVDGAWRVGNTATVRHVMRDGTMRLAFRDGGSEVAYDGEAPVPVRVLSADDRAISAEYDRRKRTWQVQINRMTGEVRVTRRGQIGFAGMCTPEPTQPKF
jgi:hypothetical protein